MYFLANRIVVYGQTMLDAIIPGSAKSFNYQQEFNLTDETTLSISDHYPVEVELKMDQKHKAPRQKRAAPSLTEPKKKKAEPAGRKKRSTTTKKKSTQSKNTPAKRQRLCK
eukprot:superscaffoldBa00014481_g26358